MADRKGFDLKDKNEFSNCEVVSKQVFHILSKEITIIFIVIKIIALL